MLSLRIGGGLQRASRGRLPAAYRALRPSIRRRHFSSELPTTNSPLQLSTKIEDALAKYRSSYPEDSPKEKPLHLIAINRDSISTEWLNKKVKVRGFLEQRPSMSKKLHFVTLDGGSEQRLQVVAVAPKNDEKALEKVKTLKSVRSHSAVEVIGTLKLRLAVKGDAKAANASQELDASQEEQGPGKDAAPQVILPKLEFAFEDIQILNEFPKDLIYSADAKFPAEKRHLQLRFDAEARRNIKFKAKLLGNVQRSLINQEFTHIDTPILFKSTPEGAREFLVPTRERGRAYALSQSPQQYKQILMASGFSRYFQVARCFRDEDLRADRQPEFTQIDLEMAFARRPSVMKTVEAVMKDAMALTEAKQKPLEVLTYDQAMSRYGSDKPDLRIPGTIRLGLEENLSPATSQLLSKVENPAIDLFWATPSVNEQATGFVREMIEGPEGLGKQFHDNPDGAPGYFWQSPEGWKFRAGDGEELTEKTHPDIISNLVEAIKPLEGEESKESDLTRIYFFQARPKQEGWTGGSTATGRLRVAVWKHMIKNGMVEEQLWRQYAPLWVVGFPLFTPNDQDGALNSGTSGFSSTHHPFTAPRTRADIDMLLTDPLKVKGDHYDFVLNGVEVGGGSVRIHNAEVQEFIMRDILKIPETTLASFSHLFEALRAGCPPHAGFAFGFDRLAATLCFEDSIRNFLAFPKDNKGRDPMIKSPGVMTDRQLKTYRIKVD